MKVSVKIQKWSALGLLAGIGMGFIWVFVSFYEPSLSEPQYEGRKLTEWAREVDQGDFFRPLALRQHKEKSEQAIVAIRQIGTNALPVALKLFHAKDSWLKKQWEEWANRHNDGDGQEEQPPRQINVYPDYENASKPSISSWLWGQP